MQNNVLIKKDVLLTSPTILTELKTNGNEGRYNLFVSFEDIQELEEDVIFSSKTNILQEQRALEYLRKYNNNYSIRYNREISFSKNSCGDSRVYMDVVFTNLLTEPYKQKDHNSYFKNYTEQSFYNGIKYLDCDFSSQKTKQILDSILIHGRVRDVFPNICENEFIVIRDLYTPEYCIDGTTRPRHKFAFRYKGGELISVDENASDLCLTSDYLGMVKPRNIEQACFLTLLRDDDVTILNVGGVYGTGKSFLTGAYVCEDLQNERPLVYVPNNSGHHNSRELGILPGDLIEKELPYMGTLIDLIGIDNIYRFIGQEMLSVVPMAIMRGRSFENSNIFVNEAQNLTREQVQLLIGRCGEGTKIIFDGDFKQTDSNIFRTNSGIRMLSKLRHSEQYGDIFGSVTLDKIERAKTANAASYLSDL